MVSNKNITLLTSLGLTPSESQLYLKAIPLGSATIIQLAKQVNMTRQGIYLIIDRMVSLGFMKETLSDSGKRLYQAVSPDILTDKAQSITSQIDALVPVLKTQEAANTSLPSISVYENPIAMREWYREFMSKAKPNEELLVWATNKAWYSVDPEFLASFIEFKKRTGTADRIIAPDTAESRLFTQENVQPNAEFRFSPDHWQTDTEKWVWRDTVSYLTIRENATNLIVIRSAQLAALERFSFERIWLGLEK